MEHKSRKEPVVRPHESANRELAGEHDEGV